MKSTNPCTDSDFIKPKNLPPPPQKKKNNASVVPVKKVVAVGTKRSNYFKGTQLSLVTKYSKKIKYVDITNYYCQSKLPLTDKCEDVDSVLRKGFSSSIEIFQIIQSKKTTELLLEG